MTTRTRYASSISIVALSCLIGGLVLTHFAIGAPDRVPTVSKMDKVVRAERFELVNNTGKVRAALVQTDEGVGLLWFDKEEKPRAMIGMGDGLLYLKLVDQATGALNLGPVVKDSGSLSQFWHFSYGANRSTPSGHSK